MKPKPDFRSFFVSSLYIGLIFLGLFMALIVCIYVQFDRNITPSVLAVHGDPLLWQRVDLDEKTSLVSRQRVPIVSLSPIFYGPHVIYIQFADKQTVWASYFHSDVGMCGQTDIFVSHLPGSSYVKFRCVIHRRPAIFFQSVTEFDGSINASETSREHPAILVGV